MKGPLAIAVGTMVVFAIAAIIKLALEQDDIDVVLFDPITLTVTNMSERPVMIKAIQVNGRQDCIVRPGIIAMSDKFEPRTLKSGDKSFWVTSCNIIRAAVTTNAGTTDFRFR